MPTKTAFSILLVCFSISASAQKSEMQEEVARQQKLAYFPTKQWDSLRCAWYGECKPTVTAPSLRTSNCTFTKRFWGWHAIGSSASSYQYSLMTDLSYFSYQVNASTGNAVNTTQMNAFPTDPVVTTALANNVKVSLCVTLFHSSTEFPTFFNSLTAQNTLITNVINLLNSANAKGVNIDFEGTGLSSTYASQFQAFMSNLSNQLHAAIPGSELSIDLQGTYANSSTMLTQLNPSVDLFILMGYDYYWAGQTYPGPVAPTYQFPKAAADPNGHGNVANDLNNIIRHIGTSKLILAMPYYGRRWRTTDGCIIPASGNATAITVLYNTFRSNANGWFTNPIREVNSLTVYNCFDENGVPKQSFIDDSVSLQKKYDLVKQRNIAGVAVWRLGYDAGFNDCWNLVQRNLTTCASIPAVDTLYDMGGPTGNYHNNQNYTFSIAPAGASSVTLNFLSFDLESNFDSLYVYNGPSASSPVLAALTGATVPSAITATSGVMTLRFKSDGATTRPGFKAYYRANFCSDYRRTISSGAWNDPSIWNCGVVPSINDTVEIAAGHTITVTTSARAKSLKVASGATLSLSNSFDTITIGESTLKQRLVSIEGTFNLSGGTMYVNGNINFSNNYTLNFTSGKLIIDGNGGDGVTSVSDGQALFNAPSTTGTFSFTGGTLQIINPPLGAGSQAVVSAYDFGPLSILHFGNGVSTIASNNPNGFGGSGMPDVIGSLRFDPATPLNNRVFNVVKPLTVKTNLEVISGNVIQAAPITVGN
jgi:spore germination protein YaaH